MRPYAWKPIGGERSRKNGRRRCDHLGYTFDGTADGEDAFVHTWDDLANTSLDTSLVAEVSDVFACLADDDASILGADESTESKNLVSGGRGRTRLVRRA